MEPLAEPQGRPCSLPIRDPPQRPLAHSVFTEAPTETPSPPSPMHPEGTKLGLWSLHQDVLLWPKLRYCRLPQGQLRPPPGLATPGPAIPGLATPGLATLGPEPCL